MIDNLNFSYLYFLVKKNIILFITLFLSLILVVYLLIQYQSLRTKDLSYTNIKIFNNYENHLSINSISQQIMIFDDVMRQAYNEVTFDLSNDSRIYLYETRPVTQFGIGVNGGVMLERTILLNELSLFATNFISSLHYELFLNLLDEDSFLIKYEDDITEVFGNSFDYKLFKLFYEKKDMNVIKDDEIKYILFKQFSNNSELFEKHVKLLINITLKRVLDNFYKNLEKIRLDFIEKYNNLIFLKSLSKTDEEFLTNIHMKNLDINYSPKKLELFIKSMPLTEFNYEIISKKIEYKNTFKLTQPNISIVIIFSLILSIFILFIKEYYLNKSFENN